jgi:hypothetical protein
VKKGVRSSAEVSSAKDAGLLVSIRRSTLATVIARSASLAIIMASLLLFENIKGHITLTSILGALCLIVSLSFYRAAMFKHLSFSLHTSGNFRPRQQGSEESSKSFHSDADDFARNVEIRDYLHFGQVENDKRGMSRDWERAHTAVRVHSPTNYYVH